MIKAVLFDLDGTLFNRTESLRHFIKEQYRRWDHQITNVNMDQYMSDFLKFDENGYVHKESVYLQLIQKYNLTDELKLTLYNDYQEKFHDHCVAMDGMDEMFAYLKNKDIQLGIITNGETVFQTKTIQALSLEDHFQTILISENEGIRKPSEAIFTKCLHQLKVSPKEAIYVGDHPENDIQAAARIGFTTIWIENGCYDEPSIADFKVKDLSHVPMILEQINRRNTVENE
ncbi:HAD family hydrolase [Pseudalkalibacillus berkeleyi]|uniref:HAD family hydrolase n=1 Tax=Pseudalkalibacillus berkeleyi TaxID=1069813 RepID=A0ABS9GYS0_9BACL|nr:HAD family hydrolase [Pseudalkalibacillus berkeleyi]MCF6136745.1 HAD family hydrolase [Pseudalkalibacillus berkeleyi]